MMEFEEYLPKIGRVEYASVKELEMMDLDALAAPVVHIGKGMAHDFGEDFTGTMLHSNIDFIKYVDMGFADVPVMVGAGTSLSRFAQEVTGHGLHGAESFTQVPGEMGAAVARNVSVGGRSLSDIISGVVCYDTVDRCKKKFTPGECRFAEGESVFRSVDGASRYIITSILVRLSRV